MPPPLREITVSHQHKEKGAIEEQRRGEERRGVRDGEERGNVQRSKRREEEEKKKRGIQKGET